MGIVVQAPMRCQMDHQNVEVESNIRGCKEMRDESARKGSV